MFREMASDQFPESPRVAIPETPERLLIVPFVKSTALVSQVVEALQRDSVVLLRGVPPPTADLLVYEIALRLDLAQSLELQSGFAGFMGHRKNVSKYFMTVNARTDYQFVSPHSEGDAHVGMQVAAFYCYQNDTDGGESILMNINDASPGWGTVREVVTKVTPESRSLTPREYARVRALYRLQSLTNQITDSDIVIGRRSTEIPELSLADVLAKPSRSFSKLLGRETYSYWDNIASIDHSCLEGFVQFLQERNLLREPDGGLDIRKMDNADARRIWTSGVDFASLFRCHVVHKLIAGDLLIQNNLSWTHAVANWTPSSGNRDISAGFA